MTGHNDRERSMTFGRAICRAFDLGRLPGRLTSVEGGLTHRMYRLETDRGTYAVKEIKLDPTNAWQPSRLERAFKLETAAYEAGVPLPRPIPVPGTDRCLAEVDPGNGTVATVRVHAWVDGEGLRRVVYGTEYAAHVGAVVAQIHALGMPSNESLSNTVRIGGDEHWLPLAERVERTDIPWRWEFRGLLPTVAELEAYVGDQRADASRLILSHRDADQKNWMKTPAGQLLLVDWDAAGPVHPRHDVANTAMAWAGVHLGEPDWKVVRAWIAGYRDAGGAAGRIRPGDLTEFVLLAIWWFEYNIRRAIGEHARDEDDRERGRDLARRAFKDLPRILRSIERWERVLGEE